MSTNNININNTFERDCRTALGKMIEIQKTHTENGNIIRKITSKINGFVATKGVILNNYDEECSDTEKKKILAKFLDDVKKPKVLKNTI